VGIVNREFVAMVTLLAMAAALALGSAKSSDVSSDWMTDSTVCARVRCDVWIDTQKCIARYMVVGYNHNIFMGPYEAADD